MFLRYVHNFRAVAILFIVAGHAAFTLGRDAEPRTMDLLADVLDYGTVLFLFVAGFLFQHWLLGAWAGAVVVRFLFSPVHGGDYSRGLFSGEYGWVDWMLLMKLVLAFALVGVAMAGTYVVRKVLGPRSRSLIGS